MVGKLLIAGIIATLGVISVTVLAGNAPSEAIGQLAFVLGGLAVYGLLQIPLGSLFWKTAPYIGAATWLGLLLTLFVGKLSHGAVRWLPLGPIHLQLSELAKPVLALILTQYIARHPLTTQRRVAGFVGLSALFVLPVFLQPDLGSALVLIAVSLAVLWLGIRKLEMLLPWILVGLVTIVFVWQFVLYPYQRDRILSFSTKSSGGATYNARQALITVGSGKLVGRGLGHGVQSTLKFLPEYHTDFFFAALAEELGFIGVMIIIGLYLALFYLIIHGSERAVYTSKVYAYALLAALAFQMAVHIGMNMRLFPITGIPLPLLSSGGSSFLSICLGLGILSRLNDSFTV